MNNTKYKKMVDNLTPKENRLLNMITSFITGGTIGVVGTLLYVNLDKIYNEELSISFVLLIIIAIIAFLTCIGVSDSLFQKFKCGLIIPITGFAHSVAASIIDYKKEGFLNMGSNAFKLAGSVLLYGIVSAIILTLIKVILNV
ncbi:MAG TPA: SpoVA/SpoVAEb family sporulation membrane protein [Candidatus Coprovivens excrementavium]|nr:SpoVA/SpoVAEb family sporulation membrane protein [Candidatus Coprovivens excrementavium]